MKNNSILQYETILNLLLSLCYENKKMQLKHRDRTSMNPDPQLCRGGMDFIFFAENMEGAV